MKKFKILEFSEYGDKNGYLVVIENNKDIPFEIKRLFYIYGTQNKVVRGKHANKYSEFILINVAGKCEVLVDDGINKENIVLDKPNKALYLDKMVWKDMHSFSEDSVLLVMSNEYYNKEEYIDNYEVFKEIIQNL